MEKVETCENCGRDLPESEFCEHCGYDNRRLKLTGMRQRKIRLEIERERFSRK